MTEGRMTEGRTTEGRTTEGRRTGRATCFLLKIGCWKLRLKMFMRNEELPPVLPV